MKGDFTRFSYDPSQHYSGVLMQQGRVSLDADWNEQVDIQTRRQTLEAMDLLGQNGAPLANGGFEVTVSADGVTTSSTGTGQYLLVTAGRMYVDGRLCELNAQKRYDQQHQYPGATVPAPNGTDTSTGNASSGNYVYLAYLDAWERHVTDIEDPNLREVALGGPDSGTRVQVVSQVKLAALSSETSPANPVAASDWSNITAPSGALLAAVPFAPDTPGALVLSGGAYVQLPTFPATTSWSNGFAIEAWVYLQGVSVPTGVPIVQLGDPTAPTILLATGSTAGSLQLTVGATSVVEAGMLVANQWVHVAVSVAPGGNVTMYTNGTQVAAPGTVALPTNAARTQCFLGHSSTAGAPAYGGMLCEVHVWSAPIHAPTLTNRLAGTEANLVAYYKLNELSYGVVDDSSPSKLNGSVQGTSTPTWSTNAPALAAAGAAASGYYGAENQLYRLEIHAVTPISSNNYTITAKWSRDNGSVAAAATLGGSSGGAPPTQTVTLATPARDDVLGWSVGQWVEISLVDGDLVGPGTLTQISGVQGSTLTVGAVTSPVPGSVKVRRWDSISTFTVTLPSATPLPWGPLENGIYVQLGGQGPIMPGDYWTMPARTVTQAIEWPVGQNGQPLALSPAGIKHHYAQLAKVYRTPGTPPTWVASPVSELRQTFPALSTCVTNTGIWSWSSPPNPPSMTVNGTFWVTGLITAAGGLAVTGGPGLTVSTSAAGAIGPVLTLLNSSGGGAGTATAINFETYTVVAPNAPPARIESIDDGNFSNHLTFSTKTPGAATNALVERMRITSAGYIGMGTNNPSYPLEVTGSALFHFPVTAGLSGGGATNVMLTVNGAESLTNFLYMNTTATVSGVPNYAGIMFTSGGTNEAMIFTTLSGSTATLVQTATNIDLNGSVTAGASGSVATNLAVNGAATVTGELNAGTTTASGSSTVNLAVNGASVLNGSVTAGASGSSATNLTVNGSATISVSAPGAMGPVLTLLNPGAATNAATAINFETYSVGTNPPCARLSSLDDGNSSNHLIFSTKTPLSASNPLVERMRLTSSGSLGIGNTAPANTLDVTGTANVTGALTAGSVTAGTGLTVASGNLNMSTAGILNFGSGTNAASLTLSVGGTNGDLVISGGEIAFLASGGVSVNGGASVNGLLNALAGINAQEPIGAAAGVNVTGTLNMGSWDANNANKIEFNNTASILWSPSAKQMIVAGGTGFTFYVNGAAGANTKPFIISHPLDPDRKLVHCCIEGPEVGVYYRGEARLSDGVATVELPPYFEALTRPEGRTVQLTPIWDGDDAPCSPLCATPVREGRFRVRAIDRASPTQRFYWEVKAVRADVAPLEVEPPRP